MHFKIKNFYLLLLLFFNFNEVVANDKTVYRDITLEQCSVHVKEFKRYLDNEIGQIIKISETDLLNVPNMFTVQLTDELNRYKEIFSECDTKKIYEDIDRRRENEGIFSTIKRILRGMIFIIYEDVDKSMEVSESIMGADVERKNEVNESIFFIINLNLSVMINYIDVIRESGIYGKVILEPLMDDIKKHYAEIKKAYIDNQSPVYP